MHGESMGNLFCMYFGRVVLFVYICSVAFQKEWWLLCPGEVMLGLPERAGCVDLEDSPEHVLFLSVETSTDSSFE